MLLNNFGQPTVIARNNNNLFFQEFKKAPLLLCHKNALEEKYIPTGWSGSMYATQEVLLEIKHRKYGIKPTFIQTTTPNETYNINMINNEKCPYNTKNIEIVAMPWNKEFVIYLIKDGNLVNLLTDVITEDMTIFLQNKTLRNSIKNGIDVLYVNDGFYYNCEELTECPSECLLGALVTIVRPRYVQGLLGEQLPQCILNCCAPPSIE